MIKNDGVNVKCDKCGIVVMALPGNQPLKIYLHLLQCPKCGTVGKWFFTKMEVITK